MALAHTGRRRVTRALAWREIEATVVDLAEIVRGEFAENMQRKAFTPTEEVAIWREIEPLERAAAKDRQGTRSDLVETFHDVNGGKTRDKVATYVGKSGRTQIRKFHNLRTV